MIFFFFNDTATTEIYTLSLHDALPISSALDPISTGKIEDLMLELKQNYSIVIVTHNMQQAARVSDRTAFFIVELDGGETRTGRMVEFDETERIFTNPADSRTEAYVTGKVG